MKSQHATAIFDALSSEVRLGLFRLLVKQGEAGLVAGEISSMLGVPPSNLSFHLKALVHAGLLSVQQEGRFQRYRANIPLMVEVINYLTNECCAGHPEQCMGLRAVPTGSAGVPLPEPGDGDAMAQDDVATTGQHA